MTDAVSEAREAREGALESALANTPVPRSISTEALISEWFRDGWEAAEDRYTELVDAARKLLNGDDEWTMEDFIRWGDQYDAPNSLPEAVESLAAALRALGEESE